MEESGRLGGEERNVEVFDPRPPGPTRISCWRTVRFALADRSCLPLFYLPFFLLFFHCSQLRLKRTVRGLVADRSPHKHPTTKFLPSFDPEISTMGGRSASYPQIVRDALSRHPREPLKILELNFDLGLLLIENSKNCKTSGKTFQGVI